MSKQVGCTPTSFLLLIIHTLVHPLHGNPYSSCWQQLMDIAIARWLASSMWTFSLFVFSTQHPSSYSIPPIVLYISMAHAHVLCESWKKLKRVKKYEPIAWLKPELCMMGVFCVTKMKHSLTIWFCRDKLSLAMLFWEDMIALLVCLKYYYFLCQYELLFWIIWI